ncbi:MAG: Maf family protein [Mangrovicoccus sp.]|nr:Maf family protein [Mangrovicoccus sp.]
MDGGPAQSSAQAPGTDHAGPRLILGSASPRRRELLAQIGLTPYEIRPADIDETEYPGERPRAYCARVSRQKAQAIGAGPGEVVLCADTTVALGRRILGKPADRHEARAFLQAMSGRRHHVITAVTVATPEHMRQKLVISTVRMRQILQDECEAYLDSDDWQGKAGGYGIQGPASAFIPWISGSYTAIVGLPLSETTGLLRAAGLKPKAGAL